MDNRVREIFAHGMAKQVSVDSGITDEGDTWFAYDGAHLAIDKSGVHLFIHQTKLISASSIEEMHSQILMWDSVSHYSDKKVVKKTVKVLQ